MTEAPPFSGMSSFVEPWQAVWQAQQVLVAIYQPIVDEVVGLGIVDKEFVVESPSEPPETPDDTEDAS